MSDQLSIRFREFAESECKDSSPLYFALSNSIAEDEFLLEVAAHSSPGQPAPNLLLASVHYLLCSGISHAVSAFYPTCTKSPLDPSGAFPAFRDFVLMHRAEVIRLLQSRLVQTNDARRSAYLFPALAFAASHFGPMPLTLVEIGTSAGLNLLWDRYRYSYGGSAIYGDPSSTVLVTSSFRGVTPAVLSEPLPTIARRIGVDLNVINTSISDQAAWLRALVWPEHQDRRALLDAALKSRSDVELDLRCGDGFAMLSSIARQIADDSLLCVYHTHVANQISQESRRTFLKTIEAVGAQRDVVHVFNNIKPNLHLTAYRSGQVIEMPLAKTDGHARWIEWFPRNEAS